MDLRFRSLAAAFLALLLVAAAGRAAEPSDGKGGDLFGVRRAQEKHAKVAAQFAVAKDGQPARLFVTAAVQPKWYTYSITQKPGGPKRTVLTVNESKEFRVLGPFVAHPQPAKKVEPLFDDLVVETHTGTVTWHAPIALAGGVDPAKLKIAGKVVMQVCDPNACIDEEYPWTASAGPGVEVPGRRRSWEPPRRLRLHRKANREPQISLSIRMCRTDRRKQLTLDSVSVYPSLASGFNADCGLCSGPTRGK